MLYIIQYLLFVVNISVIVGVLLLIIYVISNAIAQSRAIHKAPRFVREIIYYLVDFTYVWAPRLILTYIIGRLVVRLLSFLTGY